MKTIPLPRRSGTKKRKTKKPKNKQTMEDNTGKRTPLRAKPESTSLSPFSSTMIKSFNYELTCGFGVRGGWGEWIIREFEMVMYTLLYLKWITNKDLLYSTWNSTQYYVEAWMGREFGKEWIHAYVRLSPFDSITLLISSTQIQK